MQKLRQRPRADTQKNQPRRQNRAMGRMIYLLLLAGLMIGISDYVWGDRIFLRADGLILRERTHVAATSIVRIEEVAVRRGQTVSQGDLLLKLGSSELLDQIADYSTRNAELAEREAALRSRENLVTELLPLAEQRKTETLRTVKDLEGPAKTGVVISQRFEEATVAAYAAQTEFVRLSAEKSGLIDEINALTTARGHSTEALDNLQEHYRKGVITAAKSGSIGEQVPSVGQVFKAGDPILSVISGNPYVLAYLPPTYLFPLEEGMVVAVQSGRISAQGYIAEILPVSQLVPPEFQNAFKPDQAFQLVRVEIDGPSPFPTSANVLVTRPGLKEKLWTRIERLTGATKEAENAVAQSRL